MKFKEFCDILVQLPLEDAADVIRYALIKALRRGIGNVTHLRLLCDIEDSFVLKRAA